MASVVRVGGPSLLQEENERAFHQIEQSIRQYCVHSRDSAYLIRRPLSDERDHFALVWSRGIAIVEMYPFGGTIRGSRNGRWEGDAPSAPAEAENGDNSGGTATKTLSLPRTRVFFDNPHTTLAAAASELKSVAASASSPILSESRVALVALFTSPVREFQIGEPVGDPAFSMMTLDYAISRTIVHMPNILRVSEQKGAAFSSIDVEELGIALEAIALRQSERGAVEEEKPGAAPSTPARAKRRKWLWPVVVLVVALLTYLLLSRSHRPSASGVDSTSVTKPVAHHASRIVLQLPSEVELFISPQVYSSRQQLDRALARGEGQRYLPDTQQVIEMDSVVFAKGVYGYFKVNDEWRKGKLLQTLQPVDTIHIVEFLDPLH